MIKSSASGSPNTASLGLSFIGGIPSRIGRRFIPVTFAQPSSRWVLEKNPDILYVAAPNGDKKALFQFDLKERKLGRMIFAHPKFDVPAGAPIVSDKTGKVLGVRYEADRPQTYWFDKDYQGYQAIIDDALPGYGQ
ncbi:MAG: hypothetical protein Ct9H300mP7_5920 [Verrucomicrobiota bacterium]|nr:MAG: hypothetical protein Ct9H300mP7_5920 [Verrucomicrobiota bacterium]